MEQVLNEHFRAILENELWLKSNAQKVVDATVESANSGNDGRKQAYVGAALVVAGAAFILSRVLWSSDQEKKR